MLDCEVKSTNWPLKVAFEEFYWVLSGHEQLLFFCFVALKHSKFLQKKFLSVADLVLRVFIHSVPLHYVFLSVVQHLFVANRSVKVYVLLFNLSPRLFYLLHDCCRVLQSLVRWVNNS